MWEPCTQVRRNPADQCAGKPQTCREYQRPQQTARGTEHGSGWFPGNYMLAPRCPDEAETQERGHLVLTPIAGRLVVPGRAPRPAGRPRGPAQLGTPARIRHPVRLGGEPDRARWPPGRGRQRGVPAAWRAASGARRGPRIRCPTTGAARSIPDAGRSAPGASPQPLRGIRDPDEQIATRGRRHSRRGSQPCGRRKPEMQVGFAIRHPHPATSREERHTPLAGVCVPDQQIATRRRSCSRRGSRPCSRRTPRRCRQRLVLWPPSSEASATSTAARSD